LAWQQLRRRQLKRESHAGFFNAQGRARNRQFHLSKCSSVADPVRDETVVAGALRRAGFQTVMVSSDLNREAFVQTLRDFAAYADKADWAVVYFSGHGMEVAGVNYLIPIDAKLSSDRDLQFEAVPLDQVLAAVEGAKHLRLVMLDACRDKPFISQMRRHDEEVHCGNALSMVAKERLPSLRGGTPPPRHILGHAGLADVDAELEKSPIGAGEALRFKFSDRFFVFVSGSYEQRSIFVLDVLLDVLLDFYRLGARV
jgi:hypothetical protein